MIPFCYLHTIDTFQCEVIKEMDITLYPVISVSCTRGFPKDRFMLMEPTLLFFGGGAFSGLLLFYMFTLLI